MANRRHLAILKRGVVAWNKWRVKNVLIRPDLSEANLASANLSKADLSGAWLHRAVLIAANLSQANLTRADLSGANLSKVNLRSAKLGEIHLQDVNLSGVDLSNVNISRAYLCEVNLRGADLSGADLSGAHLHKVDLSRGNLSNANLSKVHLDCTDLSGAKLSQANCSEVDFSWLNAGRVELSNGNLSEAHLSDEAVTKVHLQGKDLSQVKLRLPNLSEEEISHLIRIGEMLHAEELGKPRNPRVNLSKMDFSEANLSGANLSDVNFTEADLHATNLRGANFSKATLTGADLHAADFTGTNLSGANLIEADLHATNLRGVTLIGVNLRGANLEDVSFQYSQLSGCDLTKSKLTGAKLYATARDDWIISGVECRYVYWDSRGQIRSPKNRDLALGEFERLYRTLPTIEYIFQNGMTPLDPLIMDRVVQAIREQNPDYDLKIDSITARGLAPSMRFTVLLEEYKDAALMQIRSLYEVKLRQVEEERDRYWAAITRALDTPREVKLIAAAPGAIVATDGSTIQIQQHIHHAVELQRVIVEQPEDSPTFAKVAKKTALDILGSALKDVAKGQVKKAAEQIIELGKDLGPVIVDTVAYEFFRSCLGQ